MKRYILSILEKHDRENDDSLVRLIEMKVDALNLESGYRLQFWTDVRVYGMDEALMYIKDLAPPVQFSELKEFWERKKTKLK
jgi:hypothetical protein